MEPEREPLLELGVEDEQESLASNDEWAFAQADRLVSRLPHREGKDQRTEGEVFDHKTLLTLHKLLSSGALKSLDFPVNTGKEANVFRGTTHQGGFVAVKIYRVNTATFKHVLKYIQGDDRFEGVQRDRRELVHAWAQKEFRNLHRIREAGVDVPEPIKALNNVLMTEYLGLEEGAWPALKDLGRLDDPEPFWQKIRDDYIRIVNHAGLVHADFSEYNILVEDVYEKTQRPRIIDVGQAVLRNHPMAWEFLERDARNITNYFRRQGLRVQPEDITQQVSLE